ncbi:MAG: DUF362 domain-containing protein [Bacteroidales bacterium]
MKKNISRRRFIRKTGTIGAAVAGTAMLPGLSSCSLFKKSADIAVLEGEDYFNNTIKAVEALGGMEKFVPEGSKVGLLINSDFDVFGAYVNPDISIAAIKMVFAAGASEITLLQVVKEEYWQRSSYFEEYKTTLKNLKQVETNVFPAEFNENDFSLLEKIEGGKSLENTEVVKKWLECDVFINIPIAKHHMTTLLTGALKNIMGVSTRKANITFHLGSGERNDPDYLAQCIADQNLLRKTDLCIVDATEFIIDNGPMGPGTLEKPMKIVAGSDIVAIDSLCATFLGYEPEEILTNVKGQEMGLGTMNYTAYNIVELVS